MIIQNTFRCNSLHAVGVIFGIQIRKYLFRFQATGKLQAELLDWRKGTAFQHISSNGGFT